MQDSGSGSRHFPAQRPVQYARQLRSGSRHFPAQRPVQYERQLRSGSRHFPAPKASAVCKTADQVPGTFPLKGQCSMQDSFSRSGSRHFPAQRPVQYARQLRSGSRHFPAQRPVQYAKQFRSGSNWSVTIIIWRSVRSSTETTSMTIATTET